MKRPCLTYLFLSVLLPLLLVSCRKDPLPVSSEEAEQGSGVYVSIVVNTESGNTSRAIGTPTPGEDGDGKQPGQNTDNYKENVVYDLNVFFFQGNEGINSSPETPITHCLYFSQENKNLFSQAGQNGYDATYYSATEEVSDKLQIGKTYHVLVIANYGSSLENEFQTLGTLRDFQVSQTITENGYFLMSSETDVSITVKANHENNPESVSVNIERLAARVDCHWEESYDVKNSADKVKIKSAILVNKYRGNTYAFKRVTTNITDNTIKYLGDEIVDATGKSVLNYVIDPKTLDENFVASEVYYENYYPTLSLSDSDIDWKTLDSNITSQDEEGTAYFCLDYTQENVFRIEGKDIATCVTGIIFKTDYYVGGNTDGEGETRYYSYWIRHADDNDDTIISPMEYAIVRNNIYQLNVTGFSLENVTLKILVVPSGKVENNITFD